jgi:hypothetical protein
MDPPPVGGPLLSASRFLVTARRPAGTCPRLPPSARWTATFATLELTLMQLPNRPVVNVWLTLAARAIRRLAWTNRSESVDKWWSMWTNGGVRQWAVGLSGRPAPCRCPGRRSIHDDHGQQSPGERDSFTLQAASSTSETCVLLRRAHSFHTIITMMTG